MNPYASTAGALNFDRQEHAEQVAAYVRSSGAHIGAVLDPDGEHLTLIDDTGHVLSDEQALLAVLTLVSGHLLGDTVALPVTITRHAEAITALHDVRVRRTKTATSSLMDAASEPGRRLRQRQRRVHPPRLPPGLRRRGEPGEGARAARRSSTRLSTIVEGLPASHMAHETVVTPWEQKGTVMRTLVEMSKDREVQLIDGVKVRHDDGWALAPARSRGARHPHLDRGTHRRGGARPSRRSTPAGSASCFVSAARTEPNNPQRGVEGSCSLRPMQIPDDLRYSTDHEWIRVEGGKVTIGITDYAQDALGDVVFVDLPEVGAVVEAAASISEVESTKSVSDIYAPVSGTIAEVNADLGDAPERLNEDPYGEGWICVIELMDPSQVDALLTAADYRELVEG